MSFSDLPIDIDKLPQRRPYPSSNNSNSNSNSNSNTNTRNSSSSYNSPCGGEDGNKGEFTLSQAANLLFDLHKQLAVIDASIGKVGTAKDTVSSRKLIDQGLSNSKQSLRAMRGELVKLRTAKTATAVDKMDRECEQFHVSLMEVHRKWAEKKASVPALPDHVIETATHSQTNISSNSNDNKPATAAATGETRSKEPPPVTIVISGYLSKEGSFIKSMKKRWFIAWSNGVVAYYDDEAVGSTANTPSSNVANAANAASMIPSPLGVLFLNQQPSSVLSVSDTSFKIVTPARTLFAIASTPAESEKWITTLSKLIQSLITPEKGSSSSSSGSSLSLTNSLTIPGAVAYEAASVVSTAVVQSARSITSMFVSLPSVLVATTNSLTNLATGGSSPVSTPATIPQDEKSLMDARQAYVCSAQLAKSDQTDNVDFIPMEQLMVQQGEMEMLDKEIALNEAIINERTKEIDQICNDVENIDQMFRDLATMVKEQGKGIDTIQQNIDDAKMTSLAARDQLLEADHYQANLTLKYTAEAKRKQEEKYDVSSPSSNTSNNDNNNNSNNRSSKSNVMATLSKEDLKRKEEVDQILEKAGDVFCYPRVGLPGYVLWETIEQNEQFALQKHRTGLWFYKYRIVMKERLIGTSNEESKARLAFRLLNIMMEELKVNKNPAFATQAFHTKFQDIKVHRDVSNTHQQ